MRGLVIGAVQATALLAGPVAAQTDLPSPLFCITVALCQDAGTCEARRNQPPFMLRRTQGEWVMQFGPRGRDVWVVVGATAQDVLAHASEGARIAAVAAGVTPEGAYVLHEHLLETDGLSARFARHDCETGDRATG